MPLHLELSMPLINFTHEGAMENVSFLHGKTK
jgi:hypothetical protein